ncbi:MAG: hypothetical protein O2930_00810 [Acidobacteria bacterium]|nr:hypothetical protein [Acidobacteriota bacterium]
MRDRPRDPLTAARNLSAKAWRRAAAVPKRGVKLARRLDRLREAATACHSEWNVERAIAAVARGRRPIIVGPWLSEVGFEVLYWIPFLRWFEDRYRVDRERVVAVSRGGVADWYRDVADGYVEIFDHVTPDTFSRRNAQRREEHESGGQKQTVQGSLDRDILSAVRRQTGLEDAAVCHPSLMYRLFNQFWLGNRALDLVVSHTRHLPLSVEPASDLDLPARYVAAKFYTGAALPDTSAHRGALRDLVRTVARRIPVVTLDTGMATDEHEDYLFRDIPNVRSLHDRLTPRTNLGVQASVIAGAERFIGTCGSVAWIAPMLGVNTTAVYAEDRFLASHIMFAGQVYGRMGAARFETLDVSAVMQTDGLASLAVDTVRG